MKINFRKYKTTKFQAKMYGWVIDKFENNYTLDIYFGHHVFVVYTRRY